MNEENRLIIEQLNKFGRVPETYELLKTIEDLEQENQKYKKVFDKLRKSIDDCWYMDSENVGEQVFLKKCELKDILKEVE